MNNHDLLNKFYTAFKNGDAKKMAECYHADVQFQDPAFGQLKDEKPSKMWEMLLSNKDAAPQISFSILNSDEHHGQVEWEATYLFGPSKRKVTNKVSAEFMFQEGKIISHKDHFDLWKWSQQALGPIGYLLGWSSFMRKKVQKMANTRLSKFQS